MFVVYGLPRSRTYWLSKFLTYREWVCGHDQLRYCRSMDDIKSWLSMPYTGSCETAGAWYWRMVPTLKTVVIRRPVTHVIDSLVRTGLSWDMDVLNKQMTSLDHKLDQIVKRVPDVLTVNFDELNDEQTCKRIFEFCLPHQHDPEWYAALSNLNLQINLGHELLYARAHRPQLLKLAKIARHHMLMELHVGRQPDFDDGVTIQEEPFDTAWNDGKDIMAKHAMAVGESPDKSETLNVELMQKLAKAEALQVIVGRSNGRICGYLMSIIAPSLETPDDKIGVHTVFFADPAFHGLGMKILRHAHDALRNKGIAEVQMRAGVRGPTNPRLGVLYKRLGAVPFGELYRLELR